MSSDEGLRVGHKGHIGSWALLIAQTAKKLPAMWAMQCSILVGKIPLEKEAESVELTEGS